MTDLQMLGNSFSEFGLVTTYQKILVPLFEPKVHLFENSILKIMVQLSVSSVGIKLICRHNA